MSIRVWNGSLQISVKVLYIMLLAVCSLFVGVELITYGRYTRTVGCSKSDRNSDRVTAQLHTKGRVCSSEPIVYNTPDKCPECFRPRVNAMSENFTELPYAKRLYPRGPPGYFKPRDKKQQDIVHNVLIAPTTVCTETCPYILAIQLSVTDMTEERDSIRLTWGSVAKTKIWPHATLNADLQIVFVLAHKRIRNPGQDGPGVNKPSASEWSRIEAEADRHGDVLYLDMEDSYYNLSLKLISSLHWAREHCPRTRFFLKVDADTFVNVPLLVDLLIYNEARIEYSVIGHIYSDNRFVYRTGRWAVSKSLYPMQMFPIYASGCAYVISYRAAVNILELFPYVPMLTLEDAYVTGILAREAKLNYFYTKPKWRFADFHNDKWSWCSFLDDSLVTGTGVNRKFKLMLIWSGFMQGNNVCTKSSLDHMWCRCEQEFPPEF